VVQAAKNGGYGGRYGVDPEWQVEAELVSRTIPDSDPHFASRSSMNRRLSVSR